MVTGKHLKYREDLICVKMVVNTNRIIVGGLSILLVAQESSQYGLLHRLFLRDIAGGLGLHRAGVVQYIRPEIIGLILGAFIMALFTRDFKSTGGSGPVLRFLLGALMMIGSLIFLGCPLRMILRLAGGDWNALVALPGYIVGIWAEHFPERGIYTGKKQSAIFSQWFGWSVDSPRLLVPVFSQTGLLYSLARKAPVPCMLPSCGTCAGLLVGILAQRFHVCTHGGNTRYNFVSRFPVFRLRRYLRGCPDRQSTSA